MNIRRQIVSLAVLLSSILAAPTTFADLAATFHKAPSSTRQLKNPYKPTDSAVLSAGAALFLANCAACHGKDALGAGNVPALARGLVQTASDGEVFWFISHGSPQNGMPPSRLPEAKRWQVVTYIKSLSGSSAGRLAIAPAAVSAPVLTDTLTPDKAPLPRPPFTDYRGEKPGQSHKILPGDLPAPSTGEMVGNAPEVVKRPDHAWPQVPPGFRVQLYATDLENPRLIRTAPNGDIFLADSSSGKIRLFRGLTSEGKPQVAQVFATGLKRPYGIAFYPLGQDPRWLYVGNTDAVVRFPYKSGDLHASGPAEHIVDLPSAPHGHWTRDLQFSSDGKTLFVAVGSLSNVDDSDTSPEEKNRADILAMTPAGDDVHVFASGIRNAGGGLAINPANGELWCSTNERDGLGDDLVPDYITHVRAGGFYGWPWWYIGGHQDPRHKGKHPELKTQLIQPDVLLQPHHASLQLAFYGGRQFPKEYVGDIFAAQHGSWNRSVRTGYELIRVPLHGTGKASGDYQDFMTGFVVDSGHVWGRPVGVTVAQDGALLVTDDGSNSIWRVSYTGR